MKYKKFDLLYVFGWVDTNIGFPSLLAENWWWNILFQGADIIVWPFPIGPPNICDFCMLCLTFRSGAISLSWFLKYL
jgi:hypothetical protein